MVRLTLAHFVCAILLLAVSPAELIGQTVGQAPKYEGKPILIIQFDPKEQPLDATELHDILPLKQDCRSASKGRGFNSTAYAIVNIAVTVPMPSASTSTVNTA
jgi:hypothetical protein